MKTARLTKQGKGWQLVGNKTISVMGDYGLTDDMDGQEVQFDNKGGPINFIRYQGREYKKKANPRHQNNRDRDRNRGQGNSRNQDRAGRGQYARNRGSGNQEGSLDPARAPYNFIPLNDQVVPAQEAVGFDDYAEGRLSGYLDLGIEALSDIFVRGQLEQFFAINGQYAIPGSSLRGLIRSLVEIVSYSKMEMVDGNKKLFFRNIGDEFYKDLFLENDRKANVVRQKSKAGWLTKSGNRYFLQAAPTFYKVVRRALERIGLDLQKEVYHHKEIWFDPKSVEQFHVKEIKDRNTGRIKRTFKLEYNKVNRISRSSQPGFDSATLLITGLFGRNKHFQWIIPSPQPGTEIIDVTKIIQDYEMDENRDEKADLLKALKKSKGKAVPCFFLPDSSGKPGAIGHTGIFRHPYKYRIGHAIQQRSDSDQDMTKSIFGYADTEGRKELIRAGKVFFEDAYAEEIAGKEFGALRILSSPKPTSFQLYVEQEGGRETHWGTDGHKIRGYKQYWHSEQAWQNPDILVRDQNQQELIRKALLDKSEQFTVGEILKAGSRFSGRIRFENLTEQELGALLFAVDLPNECAHKLGMGKSLGLGSVRLTPHLVIINRSKRYQNLFEEPEAWQTGIESNHSMAKYKNQFVDYVSEQLNRPITSDWENYWKQDERIKELKYMLTLRHSPAGVNWENRTRYMMIEHPTHQPKNEYRNKYTRHVLPKPSEVVRPETYKKD